MFVLESAKSYSDQKDVKVIIENESEPPKNNGWMKFSKEKFISW